MKSRVLILSFIVLSAACFKSTNSDTGNPQKDLPNSEPVLEIQIEADGMRGVAGKILLFRLYKNAVAEYDEADEQKKIAGNGAKAEEIFSRKRVKISAPEYEKFQLLFDSADFRKDFQITRESYQSARSCTDDSGLDYKISYESGGRQKIVAINNVCEFHQLTNRETGNNVDIPVTLSELIRLAYVTQLRYVYKK